jgi:hypothetical protein
LTDGTFNPPTTKHSNVIYQKGTTVCKGFGFATMASPQEV